MEIATNVGGRPIPQQQIQAVRSIARVEGEPIVVEIFKDVNGKTLRQQSFTLEQLQATKQQAVKQYNDAVVRLDEMIALLEVS